MYSLWLCLALLPGCAALQVFPAGFSFHLPAILLFFPGLSITFFTSLRVFHFVLFNLTVILHDSFRLSTPFFFLSPCLLFPPLNLTATLIHLGQIVNIFFSSVWFFLGLATDLLC
jgi:hypothetical protein